MEVVVSSNRSEVYIPDDLIDMFVEKTGRDDVIGMLDAEIAADKDFVEFVKDMGCEFIHRTGTGATFESYDIATFSDWYDYKFACEIYGDKDLILSVKESVLRELLAKGDSEAVVKYVMGSYSGPKYLSAEDE